MSSFGRGLVPDLMLVEQRKLLSEIRNSVFFQQTITIWLINQLNTPHK